MDIKTINLYLHLSESLHFSRTAQAMHVSPSALSRAMQRLEEEVDTKFNYMSKNQVYNAVDDFFDMEKSFEKISGNLLSQA